MAGEINSKQEDFVNLLSEIPRSVWEEIVKKEPEWELMEQFYDKLDFGRLSVLIVAIALNDYMLKGNAKNYWSSIQEHLKGLTNNISIYEIKELLINFYEKERAHDTKIDRLKKFFNNELTYEKLWNSSPEEVSSHFQEIWDKLANAMKQRKNKKTIVFAMKILGILLLMAKEKQNVQLYEFPKIEIPVDLRIIKFTKKLSAKNCPSGNYKEIQDFWSEVLDKLNERYMSKGSGKGITMLHLDSLIWQITPKIEPENQEECIEYFTELGKTEIGKRLCALILNPNETS